MGSDAADGVVNHRGEVFAGQCGHATHAGLYVTDGSVIPRSLGANPSLTIAALAERTARLMVAEMNALDGGASGDAADGDLLPAPAVVGPEVRFREKLGGHLMVEGQATPITLTLKVAIEDAAAVRNDPSGTELRVTGTVEAPLLHPAPMTVTWGTLRLAVEDADHAVGHRMEYRLGLRDADGVRYRLEADKLILDQPGLDWLWDATEVALVIYPDASGAPPATPEASGRGEIHAYGMARLAPFDAVRLGLSLRGSKGAPPAQQVRSVASFLHGFGRPMARTFGKSAVQGLELRQAAAAPPRRRALSLPEPERHWLGRSGGWATEEPDDPVVLLRRYAGGGAGPVLLAPGFGMSADHYLLDADPPNLTEFLVDAGHDVWLFDYRSSILFPGAGEQLNLDEIATLDWPAAVDRVRTVAGAETVQVVAHCVGSATVLMALLAGMDGVGAVVCSQMSAHFDVPSFTRFRAKLRPGPKLTRMGFRSVVPPDDDGLTARGMDLAVRANPLGHGQRCDSPICRWVFFFYGPTHHHANLDRHTHDRIAELFGEGSLWGMDHVGSMFNKGRLVDAQGGDVYLPKVASLDLPILFLAGTRNRLVLPSSSARTLAWLRSHHGPGLHRRVELPGYAHLDGLLGRRAHQDVFPHILSFLNEH
ncbi:MAG: GMC oxidoreductase [Microthrixaceae bacterium]